MIQDTINEELYSVGIEIVGPVPEEYAPVLSTPALLFVANLERTYREMRRQLLTDRKEQQARYKDGEKPSFLEDTVEIREGDWKVAEIPDDLQRRHVEITGPVSRKMVINALNSGADCYMADFEDSTAPTWHNVIDGQLNLMDAVRGTIELRDEARDRHYTLNDETATLLVRPRGLHLDEKHMLVDGEPVSASLFDFGLYFFHNATELVDRDSGPYFYLPKLEHHREARWWDAVFNTAQKEIGMPTGTIRATVLLETLPAAFQMDEILYQLRDHSAGLNCGRWDYIFSAIKTLQADPEAVLPNRDQVTMEAPFMKAYVTKVIQTCHKRGVHAMGGMAAQIPIKNDEEANDAALHAVHEDKHREVVAGHDGTWVAHPGLVGIAKETFGNLGKDNQIDYAGKHSEITEADLLEMPEGTITYEGLLQNVSIGIQYLAAWLGGNGCVPLYNKMEDAATAEISRAQVWQWKTHKAPIEGAVGMYVDIGVIRDAMGEAMANIEKEVGKERFKNGHYEAAVQLFEELVMANDVPEFLTIPAYEMITQETVQTQ